MTIHAQIPTWAVILGFFLSNGLTWLLTWLGSAAINEKYHEKHMPRSARDTIKNLRDDKQKLEVENEQLRQELADKTEHLGEIECSFTARKLRPIPRKVDTA